MKKTLLALLLVSCLPTFAQTNVSGTLPPNSHWNLAGSPYTLTGVIGIPSSVTLTVDPGVEIKGPMKVKSNKTIQRIPTH